MNKISQFTFGLCVRAMQNPFTSLGLSCPSGGDFYICQGSKIEFLGCCITNPCADGSGVCARNNLRVSSFSFDKFDEIPPQACTNNINSSWYTCQGAKPPFMGCCQNDACGSFCPMHYLYPAKLSPDSKSRSVFLTASGTPGSTSVPNNSSTSGTAKQTVAAAVSLSPGAIAGIVIGALLLILAILAGCAFMFRRGWYARRKKERETYTKSFISSSPGGTTVPSNEFASYRGKKAKLSRSGQVTLTT